MTLADVAQEEAAHAIAAEALGRPVELVKLDFGGGTAFTRLAPHSPAATIAEALKDCTIRLVGPALAGAEVASFPAFPGQPIDDRTGAQLIADRVCDRLSMTLTDSDRLIAQAERAAEQMVGNETFQAATKRVAAALIRKGSLSGEDVRTKLAQLPKISTGLGSLARVGERSLDGGRARLARRRGAAFGHSTSAAGHGSIGGRP